MMLQDKYFDEMYEYLDTWAGGFVKAYMPTLNASGFALERAKVVDIIHDRLSVVNRLRKAIGLENMCIEESYDYYINNMPEFDDFNRVIEYGKYSKKTRSLAFREREFAEQKPTKAYSYLTIIGAPDEFIENAHVVQERIDHINRLLKECGHEQMTAQKTEEVLLQLITKQY